MRPACWDWFEEHLGERGPMVLVRKPQDWRECSLEGIVLAQPERTA